MGKIRLFSGLAAFCLLLTGLAACGKTKEAPTAAASAQTTKPDGPAAKQAAPTGRSKLTGLPIEPDRVDRRILAVMFDNHPDARPQAGVDRADVMFEIKVEGSYTRYMGLYQSQAAERLGPVRSARDCFIDRALEYNAVYSHFGGSYLALNRIEQFMYPDLNGMTNASAAMYRDSNSGKISPHNVFTDTDKLRQAAAARSYPENLETPAFADFNSEPVRSDGEGAMAISIQYASDNRTDYKWSEADRAYLRYKDNVQDIDEGSKTPWLVDNIIIQKAKSYIEPAPLRTVEQVGRGEGFYISRGAALPITWEKGADIGPTYYKTLDGKPLSMNPGKTWVQVVDPDTPVSFQ